MSASAHPGSTPYYFVPAPSHYPAMTALGMFFVILGAGQWVNGHGWGAYSLLLGVVIWLSVLNATLCTFAPVLMVMMAVERIGPALTAQTGMIGPMSTIGMGVLLLGEPFTAWVAAGTALVLAGVWLLAKAR